MKILANKEEFYPTGLLFSATFFVSFYFRRFLEAVLQGSKKNS